jgi:signal transduction histidine kinase
LNVIIDKSRTLATRLRPSTLDILGLPAALKMMFAQVNHNNKLKIDFRHSSLKGLRFKSETINLFRVIQEAVTNVLKHARATKVEVRMKKVKGMLNITIKDNGQGFAVNSGPRGLGLATMHERVKLLGGSLEIDSAPKKGTTVRLDVPVFEEKP